MSNPSKVRIELSREEALVLLDYLQREIDHNGGNSLKSSIDHDAEIWALNELNCLLERVLTEPFDQNYSNELSAAQGALVARCGKWFFTPIEK